MIKNGREYLDWVEEHIRTMDERINRNIERLAELRANAQSLSAISNGERVQTSSTFDKTGDLLAKIAELEIYIDERIDSRNDFIEKVKEKLRRIEDDKLYNVLVDRYIHGKTDSMIAEECHITDRGARKRAVKALAEFDKIYKKS